ncbi:MAG: AAA family ATPase [Clostridia bacterium]|nr:AAA family ATPase [Clostridia bacterium]
MNKKYKDGGVYEGDGTLFTKKRHGKGKMVYANGDIYEGEWVDDVRSGQGTLTRKKYLSQNYCYTGEWKNDMQNGKGTLTEGNRIYEGDFVNGKYEGKGRLTQKVGSYSYEGDFKGGYKEGNGTEKCPEYTYTGQFVRDKFHGNGKQVFPNKDYLDGRFSMGFFQSGKGRFMDEEGTVYEGGLFSKNKLDGKCKITYKDGTVVSGTYSLGKRDGKFLVTMPSGEKRVEQYKNDVLVEPVKKEEVSQPAKIEAPSNPRECQEQAQRNAKAAYELKARLEKELQDKRQSVINLPSVSAAYNAYFKKYDRYRGEKKPNGAFHGFGIYAWAGGATYEGEFVNGKIKGLGIYRSANNEFVSYGNFEEQPANHLGARVPMIRGLGVRTAATGGEHAGDLYELGYKVTLWVQKYRNGDLYEGQLCNGSRSGMGVLTYASKDVYEGSFASDLYEGKGKLTLADGTVYEGKFKGGKKEGVFTVTLPNGTTKKEKYKKDELVDGTVTTKAEEVKKDTAKKATTKKATSKKADEVTAVNNEQANEKATAKKAAAAKKSTVTEGQKVNGKPSAPEKPEVTDIWSILGEKYKDLSKRASLAAQKARESCRLAEKAQADSQSQYIQGTGTYAFKSATERTFTNKSGNGNDTYKGGYLNGKIDGFGVYNWVEGDRYEGMWKSGERTGLGIYHYTSGNMYEGQFTDGKINGKGVFTYKDGDVYKGEFYPDDVTSYGVYYYKSGNKYEGEWKGDKRWGLGVLTWSDGFRYEGYFVNDDISGEGITYDESFTYAGGNSKRGSTGKGTMVWKNGNRYTGDWVDGNRNGNGKMTWHDGDSYDGQWKDDLRHGKGTYIWGDGDIYEGDWKNGERTGKGTFIWKNSGNKYKGDFVNGERSGKGIFYYKNGDKYNGEHLNNSFHGKGTYTWGKDSQWAGDKYEGEFTNDEITGKGTYYHANGDVYVGDLVKALYHGKGTLTYADGRVLTGEWENNKFVDKNEPSNSTNNDESKTNQSNSQNEQINQGKSNRSNQNNAVKTNEEKPLFEPEITKGGITFDDVAGLDEVKDQIKFHVLEPMRDPELAKAFGIEPGGKILLYGPPGTGKTLVARAIAGEIDAAFYSISCQDLISKWLGESSERLNKLFDEAQKHENAIIFFDEFDSVASKRDGVNESKEMSRFVATFLTKVDGFKPIANKMMLLIAATNRPWALDSAMVRGGRFDTQIYVGLPDQKAREFLVNKSLGKLPLAEGVSLEELAGRLEGFGGGDITAACDKIRLEAYKRSVKMGKMQSITQEDCDSVISKLAKSVTPEELARFEAYKNGEKID